MTRRLLAALAALVLGAAYSGNVWAQGAGAQTISTLLSTYRIPVIAGNATLNQETTLATLAGFIGSGGGGTATQLVLNGTTSGAVTVKPGAAAAGTFNFNLPVTAGASGAPLLSGAGGSTAMTWGTVTGTGNVVKATSPTITTPTLTTPTSTDAILSGHPTVSGTAPALTSCGTSPAIAGSDLAGEVTMGTDTPTGCVITFAVAYSAAPFCTVTWQATPLASQSYALSTTAITLTQTATSSNKIDYHCLARSGG